MKLICRYLLSLSFSVAVTNTCFATGSNTLDQGQPKPANPKPGGKPSSVKISNLPLVVPIAYDDLSPDMVYNSVTNRWTTIHALRREGNSSFLILYNTLGQTAVVTVFDLNYAGEKPTALEGNSYDPTSVTLKDKISYVLMSLVEIAKGASQSAKLDRVIVGRAKGDKNSLAVPGLRLDKAQYYSDLLKSWEEVARAVYNKEKKKESPDISRNADARSIVATLQSEYIKQLAAVVPAETGLPDFQKHLVDATKLAGLANDSAVFIEGLSKGNHLRSLYSYKPTGDDLKITVAITDNGKNPITDEIKQSLDDRTDANLVASTSDQGGAAGTGNPPTGGRQVQGQQIPPGGIPPTADTPKAKTNLPGGETPASQGTTVPSGTSTQTQPVNFGFLNSVKVSYSVGFIRSELRDDNVIATSNGVGKFLLSQGLSDGPQLKPLALMHLSVLKSNDFLMGPSFGTTLGSDGKGLGLLAGWSVSFGKAERLSLNFLWEFQRVNRLQGHAFGDLVDSDQNLTRSVMRNRLGIGISYMFPGAGQTKKN